MNFCPDCGKEVNKNDRFCSFCGKSLQNFTTDFDNKKEKKERNDRLSSLLCVCAAVLVVVMIGVAGVKFYNSYKVEKAVSKDISEKEATEKTVSEYEEVTTEKTTEKTTTTTKPTTTKPTTTKPTTTKENRPKDADGIVMPDKSILGNKYFVNAEDGLYLRKGPDTQYDSIIRLVRGEALAMSGERADAPGWYYVFVSRSGEKGWVKSQELVTRFYEPDNMGKYFEYKTPRKNKVNEPEGLNLRTKPTTSAEILGTIPDKREVEIYGYSAYDSDWLYISVYLDGKTQKGYVHGDYLTH